MEKKYAVVVLAVGRSITMLNAASGTLWRRFAMIWLLVRQPNRFRPW